MNIIVSKIRIRQKQLEKQTIKAASIIFESDFGKNAYNKAVELTIKYNPANDTFRRKKFHIRLEEDPKRVIAWSIAQRVQEARERQYLTQEDLAKKTGIARPNIVRLEQGRHLPTISTLHKVAKALGLDMRSLMAPPAIAQEDRREFTEVSETGLDEWMKELETEDSRH